MDIVTFEKPPIEKDVERPVALAGQGYPYNLIASTRRFEELIYSICKAKISDIFDEGFDGFDEVSLMTGVADRGRDCALFKNGKAHGLVQCKNYSKNYSKEDFGLEMTKFILYSLLERKLIYDKKDFTYYIAVSTGFTAECSEFIVDFQNNIQNEANLARWIQKNLLLPTLAPLRLQDRVEEVKDILSCIRVKRIIPQDLDADLSKPACLTFIPLFFAVRTVTDNSLIAELKDVLTGKLTKEKIVKELNAGSVGLESERNEFEGIHHSHIDRNETEELFQWILAEPSRNGEGKPLNVCLLSGQAGYGKTVILRDLYHQVAQQGTPVLGLKADKLYAYTISDLQKSIGLSVPVVDFVEASCSYFPLTVILVDQIDALSQSMSSDRTFLNVYRFLIDSFANKENVKIVISVRTSDLHYDPSLRVFKDVKTVTAQLLSDSQVMEQFSKIGIVKDLVSPKLLELLRTPNNLNIFSRIARNDSSLHATTVQDLYFELWNSKVRSISGPLPVKPDTVKKVLYNISTEMFKSQRITVSVYRFEDHSAELNYLESEYLIKSEGKQLQFFHQSFYDFVFSKQFVEAGKDLHEYIISNEQSIHIRSAVKMILAYLRDFDPHLYAEMTDKILWDDQVFFHIKHLLVSSILSQVTPTKYELGVMLKAFNTSVHFATSIFEQASDIAWFNWTAKNSLMEFLKRADKIPFLASWAEPSINELISIGHACTGFLLNFLSNHNLTAAWAFAKEIHDRSVIKNILYSLENFSNPILCELFERYSSFEEDDSFGYYHVLNKILKTNPAFVLNKIEKALPLHYKSDKRAREYEESTVLKNLAKSVPEKLFPVLFEIIRIDIEKTILFEDNILGDYKYRTIDLDEDYLERGEFLYRMTAICLRKSATSKAASFNAFLSAHKKSEYYSILRLLVFAFGENEATYRNEVFDLFTFFMYSRQEDLDSPLGYEMRQLLEKTFPSFDRGQTIYASRIIENIVNNDEIYFYDDPKSGKRKIRSFWGRTKYPWLLKLPSDFLLVNPLLHMQLLELKRKFPDYRDNEPRDASMRGVYSPIPEKAHEHMSKMNWIKSFKKYNGERDRSGEHIFEGGVDELASAFQAAVKKNPTIEKLDILSSSIDDPNIDIKYVIYGLRGWSESAGDRIKAIPLFKRLLEKDHEQYLRDLISIASNLIGTENDDLDVINFLVKTSLRFNEDFHKMQMDDKKGTSIRKLATIGVNTPYGAAAKVLVHVEDSKFIDLIFETFKEILFNAPVEARAAALCQFAFLMNLDRDKACDLFASIVNSEGDIDVLASAIWSFQYMGNYNFATLHPAYSKLAISKDLGNEDSHHLFILLYGSYMYNQPGAKDLLYLLLDNNKHSCSGAVIDIMKHYNQFLNEKDKNDALLDYVLSKSEEEDYEKLSWSFLNAEHLRLDDIHLFLRKYVQSKHFTLTEYFLEYLTLQSGQSPFVAVELFEKAMNNSTLKIQSRLALRLDNSPMKFIVGAFNALNDNDDNSKATRKKLLKLFDKILIDYRFKNNAEKVLEELL
ncbi:NACHT domain-containing NTPase [Dyadobacter sp. CY326]|uniref:NACHT domain-containing protein n=1 Tax=Dyadobacter sp. CY326 TaxID=2907300 RepID=UPI001F1EE921|nr:hypothetical protein [Dyadobacter sp. CY326]MCE7067405.1 hypothetical protein [Dyadobacter sp. CY326]